MEKDVLDRLETALRGHDLKGLVDQLRREGHGQAGIFDRFSSFALGLEEQGRATDEDEVGKALDFIWGWCRREAMWFDHTLTDEELRAHRQSRREPGEAP